MALGRLPDARACIRRALEHDPRNIEVSSLTWSSLFYPCGHKTRTFTVPPPQAQDVLRGIDQRLARQAVSAALSAGAKGQNPGPPRSPSHTDVGQVISIASEDVDGLSISGSVSEEAQSTPSSSGSRPSRHPKALIGGGPLGGCRLDPDVLPPGLRSGGMEHRHIFNPSRDGIHTNLLVLLHGLGVSLFLENTVHLLKQAPDNDVTGLLPHRILRNRSHPLPSGCSSLRRRPWPWQGPWRCPRPTEAVHGCRPLRRTLSSSR